MNFPIVFFKDEVRLGFYIPTAVKQAWAANLTVLFEIDRICVKHGITYFADWGSVLGTVRHGGYVPWDDDLDICMKRDDYERFRAVTDAELPAEFAIHDFESKENHRLFLARVVNANQISFDEAHLKKYHNFPYISVVDIFILDYLHKDAEKERARCERIKRLIAVADGVWEGSLSKEAGRREAAVFEKQYDVKLPDAADANAFSVALYKLAQQEMCSVPESEADQVGQIFPWILKGGKGQPKAWYEKTVRLPFENTTIPVPACYNEMLKRRYGDYLQIRKVWGGHNYPYFEGQRKNLQAVADFDLPEFSFSPELLQKPEKAGTENSLRQMSAECVAQLEVLTRMVKEGCTTGQFETVITVLPELQQLAVDFGTLVETVKGEERPCAQAVVEKLHLFCEKIYELFTTLDNVIGNPDSAQNAEAVNGPVEELNIALQEIKQVVQTQLIDRKEVLFVATGAQEWQGFEAAYRAELAQGDTDVFVVAVPVMFKDMCGHICVEEDEIDALTGKEQYPTDLLITDWMQYLPEQHMPERVYVQDPYEAENPCLTIPPQFYASCLMRYTDEMIFIPAFKTGEFSQEDINDIYNLKHYVTAPAVIRADRVLVQSENIRQRYIEKLLEFAGDESREVWENKIQTNCFEKQDMAPQTEDKQHKKRLLFCLGLNELAEHADIIEQSIKDRLNIFVQHETDIEVKACLYPEDTSIWYQTDKPLAERVLSLLSDHMAQGDLLSFDAYYGSPTPLVPEYNYAKKPVMIADFYI